jgi:amidase
MPVNDIVFNSAKKLASLLRTRKLSAVELMKAHIAQVERLNPQVNAIVTFLPDAALKEARKLDAKRARAKSNDDLGPLAGLPIAARLSALRFTRTTCRPKTMSWSSG